MVLAHLMSIQIDDGSPGDAFHSLKQELRDEWKINCFLSDNDTCSVRLLAKGFQSKSFNFEIKLYLCRSTHKY